MKDNHEFRNFGEKRPWFIRKNGLISENCLIFGKYHIYGVSRLSHAWSAHCILFSTIPTYEDKRAVYPAAI